MLERLCIPLAVILMVFYYVVPVDMSPILLYCYVSTCPTPSEIKQRSLNHTGTCSKNKTYHIVWDPEINKYAERCFKPQPIPPGYATILDKSSGFINTEACHEGTFQPSQYKSDTQCACKETKGHCNKTGQVVASNGSTTEDRTCRCDFRRGYKFSTKPSNKCVCQSSIGNCTCTKQECETGYIMSPDYECVSDNLYYTTNYTCKDYITSEESTTKSVPDSDILVSLESTTESTPVSGTSERMPTCTVQCYVKTIIICIVVFAIVFCVLGAFCWKKKMIKIISCICAPMCICCKKCRPGRNGSAPTNDEGTSTSKDSDPVQEIGSDAMEMSSLIKGDESEDEQPSTADDCLGKVHFPVQTSESNANDMLPDIKVDESNDEVTNRQPSKEDNYLENKVWINLPPKVKMDKQEDYVTY